MLRILKTIFLITVICQLPSVIFAQRTYWQQQVNYSIDVSLNDKEHTLDGFAHIEYINNSPDTIKYIWFHLWPNAYKNDKTAFSEQLLENGNTTFYFSNKDDRGYINRIDFKVNNITAEVEDHPLHIDIVKLLLPTPLPPGQKTNIATPFHVKLPYNFSRGGHEGQSYQVTQWYPKPAVYDHKGWHAMPYLDQGEFYSEFGNFDVKISLPKNYVVAATGQLQDEDEKQWLRSREPEAESHELEKKPQAKKTATKKPKQTNNRVSPTNPKPAYRTGRPQTPNFPPSSPQIKTIQFKQDNIHDFAWFADKRFIVNYDTCKVLSGKIIDIFTYYTPQQSQYWQNSIQFGKDAIRFYSEHVGEYPYNVVSTVQGPEAFAGGMEYPTITVIAPVNSVRDLDYVIAHEIGHNWFYGVLASNERRHAWMDEGINTFYANKYYRLKYGKQLSPELIFFETTATTKTDQPIEAPSENFSSLNYGLAAYYKSAEWMRLLESQSGNEAFNKAMQEYYQQWQFKHPYPEDFKRIMEESTKKNLDSTFALLNRTGTLPNQKRSGSTLAWLVTSRYKTTFLNNRSKDLFTLSPVPGYNSYDKFLAGIMITNFKLPPSRFQFLILPMYATGSKKPAGLGKLDYSFYPGKAIRKVNLFVNGSSFSMDEYTDDNGNKTILSYQKIVPGIKLTAKEKNARSTIHKFIQWKTFFINEDALTFSTDTIINGPDTTIGNRVEKEKTSRTLNQLKMVVENYRVLYPFRAELNAEHGEGFIRLGFTGNYFFNYTSNKGGVDIRLFAGKFFYLNKQKANVFLYALSLSAPKGNMDYTYSDYFMGRNEYPFRNSGVQWTIPYQQIMIRDGGLKMNTDAQGNIGSSDDWLSAINVSLDIPSRINPLSVLPFKIPLKIFADVGTYAEAWKKDVETDRFLYNAGIQISMLKEIINIYIPVLYSPVFKDYVKSVIDDKNRFLKTISFSIDISKFNTKKLTRKLPCKMSGSYPIRYLTNEEIDTTKWNNSIDTATNGLVYGYSYYLNAMAVHWDALVLNDYEAVMPLTWKRKLGIYYLYQPFLSAQLGVFGKNINAELLSAFLKAVPEKFRYWDFYLNHQNVFAINEFEIYQRSNYILDLQKPYEQLYKAYRENIKRNIKKALQLGCSVKKDFEAGQVIQLALTQIRHQDNNREDFNHFLKLYHLLHAKQQAITYGIFSAQNELMASCIFFFSHKRAYYILVGNHPNGKTIGASHSLIDGFIQDHAGQNLWLDFEGSDIRNLAFFYSGFGAIEEKFAGIKRNRLPWLVKWLKR